MTGLLGGAGNDAGQWETPLLAARDIMDHISHFVDENAGGLPRQVADAALKLAGDAVRRATPEALLKATGEIAVAIFTAFAKGFGQLPVIRNGILGNNVNAPTLELVWGQRTELISFLVDILECTKGLIAANGFDLGNASQREYNELDVANPMNRHGIVCQVQRLVKSLVSIFRKSRTVRTLADIDMTEETTLESDLVPNPDMALDHHIQSPPSGVKARPDEHWLFINGIGGEYYWLGLACKKLSDAYGREVTGIFNRGDGLLWDLVECGGQRSDREAGSTSSQDSLLQATRSCAAAQRVLYTRLESILKKPEKELGPIVMVAHSQGCLVLRLVLQELVAGQNQGILRKMKKHLCVFTFGNPSIHWTFEGPGYEVGGQRVVAKELFCRTEHFANETDFVAKLGVLRDGANPNAGASNNGYSEDNVFVNRTWKGHMFGAQYSLNPGDYDRRGSWLLNCNRQRAMGPPAPRA